MKKVFMGLITLIAITFMACSGGSTPGKMVKATYENLGNGNYDKVIKNLTGTKALSEEETTKLKGLLASSANDSKEKGGIKAIEILEETISEDGSSATVKVKTIFGDDSEDTNTVNCIKEEGDWKIEMNAMK